MTDIVLATYNRPHLLVRTLERIAARTVALHRVIVVDDGSTDHTLSILGRLVPTVVDVLVPRPERLGIPATLRDLLTLTTSDPLVYTDDDVLCPRVEPDYLTRLLTEMKARPYLGVLALNSPQNHPSVGGDRRRIKGHDGEVTLCRNVAGRFTMIRRAVLESMLFPDGEGSPLKGLCIRAGQAGWGVGFLAHTYCQHLGDVSVRNGMEMSAELEMVRPVNDETLEPPEAYREC